MRPWLSALSSIGLISSFVLAGSASSQDEVSVPSSSPTVNVSRSWIDWSDWRPSVAIGAGISNRWVESSTVGILSTLDRLPPNNQPELFVDPVSTNQLAYIGLPVSAQVMAPALEKLPLQPRVFAQGGYIHMFGSDTLLANAGEPPRNWFRGFVTPVRVELRARSNSRWFVGGGFALKVPWDLWESYFKLSVNYYQDSLELDGIVLSREADPAANSTKLNYIVREIGPGVGFDVELSRRWGTSLGLFFDFQVGVPLNDEPARFATSIRYDVLLPDGTTSSVDGGTQEFFFDPGVHLAGMVGIRFTWVGL